MAIVIFFIITVFTCLNHCILGLKIHLKKRSLSYRGGSGQHHPPGVFVILCRRPQQAPQAPIQSPRVLQAPHPNQNSTINSLLLDHFSSMMFLALVVMVVLLFFFGGLPQVLLLRVVLLSFLIAVMPLSVYVRKSHVRATLYRELKEVLRWT